MTRPWQRAVGAATGAQEPVIPRPGADGTSARRWTEPPQHPGPQTACDQTPRRRAAATAGDHPAIPRSAANLAPPPGRRTRWIIWLAAALVTAAVSIGVALKVTPLQTVTVAGQVIKVGTTAPTLSFSGPGEIDLFGQSLPTHVQFLGPVRPRLQLTQITINSELTNFVQGAGPAGAERVLGDRLASGWTDYFAWETGLTAVGALILLGAVAGWPLRRDHGQAAGGGLVPTGGQSRRDHAPPHRTLDTPRSGPSASWWAANPGSRTPRRAFRCRRESGWW